LKAAPLVESSHQLFGRIDVEPFAATPAGFDRLLNQPAANASSHPARVHRCVEQEEVRAAIPSHVRESNEFIAA